MNFQARTLCFIVVLLLALPGLSAGQNVVASDERPVQIEIDVLNRDHDPVSDAGLSVLPGDVLSYRVVFTNPQDVAVEGLDVAIPVSQQLLVDARSFDSETPAEISVRGPDEEFRSLAAVLGLYEEEEGDELYLSFDEIRWEIAGPLAPGEAVELTFVAVVSG